MLAIKAAESAGAFREETEENLKLKSEYAKILKTDAWFAELRN
jgi:hypothetical protein